MRTENKVLIICLSVMAVGMLVAVAYGSSNSTSTSSNMTLDCIRMFYSDEWNKGYVEEDLAKYCNSK